MMCLRYSSRLGLDNGFIIDLIVTVSEFKNMVLSQFMSQPATMWVNCEMPREIESGLLNDGKDDCALCKFWPPTTGLGKATFPLSTTVCKVGFCIGQPTFLGLSFLAYTLFKPNHRSQPMGRLWVDTSIQYNIEYKKELTLQGFLNILISLVINHQKVKKFTSMSSHVISLKLWTLS